MDPFGAAVIDFYKFRYRLSTIKVFSNISGEEKIKPGYLFRNFSRMPKIEQKALKLCKGYVLDVGAGAGSHALYLQSQSVEVCALDISPGCCQVMEQRGVREVVCKNILEFKEKKFDAILLLMNGIGISGSLKGLRELLQHLKLLLNPSGQIIFDSSDIDYIYYEKDGSKWINLNSEYYGEVKYTLSYKNIRGDAFDWLFIDPDKMNEIALEEGFVFTKLADGPHNDYLGKLILK